MGVQRAEKFQYQNMIYEKFNIGSKKIKNRENELYQTMEELLDEENAKLRSDEKKRQNNESVLTQDLVKLIHKNSSLPVDNNITGETTLDQTPFEF